MLKLYLIYSMDIDGQDVKTLQGKEVHVKPGRRGLDKILISNPFRKGGVGEREERERDRERGREREREREIESR